jgi:hypothetical protein
MDMRVYSGCLSDDLTERFKKLGVLEARLMKKFPDSHVTFYPVEGKWVAHIWGTPLSGMHVEKEDTIMEALGGNFTQ